MVVVALALASLGAPLGVAAGATRGDAGAPYTRKALTPVLKAAVKAPVTIHSVACKNGWASGSYTIGRPGQPGTFDAAFLAKDKGGKWVVPKRLPCKDRSIPMSIYKRSPCAVS